MKTNSDFNSGILQQELFMGLVSAVSAYVIRINLNDAGNPSGWHYSGNRYGKGEVGEFVLIEGQISILLGRLVSVKLPEMDRKIVTPKYEGQSLNAYGEIQLLGTVAVDSIQVTAGVDSYPRIGDRVFAAPISFVSNIPNLKEQKHNSKQETVTLRLGSIGVSSERQSAPVEIRPEKLFGRHCAILGATGGGKSWTTARIIEECIKYESKLILIDATGEYRNFSEDLSIENIHLGKLPVYQNLTESLACSLPPSVFTEADFVSLFQPSPGIQAPKFREALVSLRIVYKDPSLGINGVLKKAGRPYSDFVALMSRPDISIIAHNPSAPIDCSKLISQIECECVWEDPTGYGRKNDQQWGYCSTLVARIASIINSPNLDFIFASSSLPSLANKISEFINKSDVRLLRICLSGVSYEYGSREILGNTIARLLLNSGRNGEIKIPLILFVDEAHNFIGKSVGVDESASHLDAFELIAKEGRKYGLNLCLATQRPRDITEGVLSQMGTLIVHRLTNDRDRDAVERACGEIDKSASAFLPNLRPGEVAIIGADFPIPLTIQIEKPFRKPESDGPNYQTAWRNQS